MFFVFFGYKIKIYIFVPEIMCVVVLGIGLNGAETNCGIAHILGILLMNSYYTGRRHRVDNHVRIQSFFFLCSKMPNGNTWQCFIGQCTKQRSWRCFHWSIYNRKHVPSIYVFTGEVSKFLHKLVFVQCDTFHNLTQVSAQG